MKILEDRADVGKNLLWILCQITSPVLSQNQKINGKVLWTANENLKKPSLFGLTWSESTGIECNAEIY
jgi:hypothetical protein